MAAKELKKTLSEELVVEILKRLSVKDITRYKCVCKSWGFLLTSRYFIEQHLRQSNNDKKDPNLLVKYKDVVTRKFPVISIFSHQTHGYQFADVESPQVSASDDAAETTPQSVDEDKSAASAFEGAYFLGCCNGVVCFYDKARNVVLWNPAIRDAKLIPPPLFHGQPEKRRVYSTAGFGFGFDAQNNDYKVVAIQELDCVKDFPPEWPMFEVEVYSLKANAWRKLRRTRKFLGVSLTRDPYKPQGVCTGGMYSWLVEEEKVVSYDMCKDVLVSTPLPKACKHLVSSYKVNDHVSLVLHNGNNIALTHTRANKFSSYEFKIWVLREYGKKSWVKVLNIGPCEHVYHPVGVGIWNNFEVFISGSRYEMLLLNPITRRSVNIVRSKRPHHTQIMQVFSFRESLVPVTRFRSLF